MQLHSGPATSPNVGFSHGGSARELQALLINTEEDRNDSDLKGGAMNLSSASLHQTGTSSFSTYFVSVFSAVLYGTVGLVMGFANKAVLQIWPFSNTLLMLQMATSILLMYAMHFLGIIHVRPLEWRAAKNLAWVVFFYNANVAFALAAVRALSIPVYHVMKRLTPVMVLGAKWLLGDAPPPLQVTLSVLTVVAGCILAGLGDLTFDAMGYLMALTSCALQTTYLIMVERSGTEKGYNSNELLLYNAVLSLPVLILLTWGTGELRFALPALTTLLGTNFLWLVIVSLLMGCLLNYALFLCTITNSALSTTIVGTLRSVVGTILGFWVLGGVKATPLILSGVTVNTAGGVWYTVVKFRQKHYHQQGGGGGGGSH
eukprot:TRINITY_DN23753_c0_g1_i1.p1 TRINITY_DN23753_c0_g1~~TRINITY_DN23753_c0_g1_i1.p1  ORF type:complete len:373 (+),score=66.26 TRINITY_DN23753_c0_g1_i1:458-1576(+)